MNGKLAVMWVAFIAIAVAALMLLGYIASPFDIPGYRVVDDGENTNDGLVDTRIVISGFPEEPIVRGTTAEMRIYVQTLDLQITEAVAVVNGPSIHFNLIGHDGRIIGTGSMPSDYCVTHPDWVLTASNSGLDTFYTLKVWLTDSGVYEMHDVTYTIPMA